MTNLDGRNLVMNMDKYEELKANRKDANKLIIEGLERYIEINPDLRFIQALWALQVLTDRDLFHEESVDTLMKLMDAQPSIFLDYSLKDIDKHSEHTCNCHNHTEDVLVSLKNKIDELESTSKTLKEERDDALSELGNLRLILSTQDDEMKKLKNKHELLLEEYLKLMRQDKDMLEEFVRKLIDNQRCVVTTEPFSFEAEEEPGSFKMKED